MIGVLGGTFDPIHYGHLRCAIEVKALLGLEQVRLIPNGQPPHREAPEVAPWQRAEMVELAIQNHAGLICDRRELERPSPSFMVDTLASLRNDFPCCPLLLLIGNDAFRQLTQWHRWQQLFEVAHIVVMTRPGWTVDIQTLASFFQARLATSVTGLQRDQAGKLFFQAVTPLDISATAIRNGIAKQQDPSFLLPDAVIAYIRQHKLYQVSE
jgi:nicotinate-nucleotide adenylyltransferase